MCIHAFRSVGLGITKIHDVDDHPNGRIGQQLRLSSSGLSLTAASRAIGRERLGRRSAHFFQV